MSDISYNLNSSLANMSSNDLETELTNLKVLNTNLQKKVDDYEQQIHELKRQLSTSRAMESDLMCEIESFNSDNDKLLRKNTVLEEEIHNLKQRNDSDIKNYYESELVKKDEKIQSIIEKNQIKQNDESHKVIDENNKYKEEICDLKLKIEEFVKDYSESELKTKDILDKNITLENNITELKTNLDELKECLSSTKQELQQRNDFAHNLQDEMTLLQMELDQLKSVPVDKASKGNSLFAEVNDNRVKLQKHVETVNKKYSDMKLKYSNKSQELQKLHLQYADLIKVMKDKNNDDDKEELSEMYKKHYSELTKQIKKLENELELQKQSYSKLVSGDLDAAFDLVTITRNEVIELQQKLSRESLRATFSAQNYYDKQTELNKCQTEMVELRAKVLSLTQEISNLKLIYSPDEIKEQKFILPIPIKEEKLIDKLSSLKNSNPHTYLENWNDSYLEHFDTALGTASIQNECKVENKENVSVNKTVTTFEKKNVTFSQNTSEEEKVTARKMDRKIIKCQPVFIPSFKKN